LLGVERSDGVGRRGERINEEKERRKELNTR